MAQAATAKGVLMLLPVLMLLCINSMMSLSALQAAAVAAVDVTIPPSTKAQPPVAHPTVAEAVRLPQMAVDLQAKQVVARVVAAVAVPVVTQVPVPGLDTVAQAIRA